MPHARRFPHWTIVFVILVVLSLVIGFPNFLSNAVGKIGKLMNPAQGRLLMIQRGAIRIISTPFRGAQLQRQVDDLSKQVRILSQSNANLQELEKENNELRRELKFFEQQVYPFSIARVIGRFTEGGSSFLTLNRGQESGVVLGAPVTVDGVLIGKIIAVRSTSSTMIPLTTAGVKTAAAFAGAEKTAGIVEGELNVNLFLTLVPKDIALVTDKNVITSGLEEGIPRGLLIGYVAQVENSSSNLFQTALLRAPIRLEGISLVSIITLPSPAIAQ